MEAKTAVIDLDGTLAEYNDWVGVEHYGDPIRGAKEALERIKYLGFYVVIFTTRGRNDLTEKWLIENDMTYDAINSTSHNPPGTSHKPIGTVYFDDRDIHCVGNGSYDWDFAIKRFESYVREHY